MEHYSLDELESALTTRFAHVLRPAIALNVDVCLRCRGAKSPSYRECAPCSQRDKGLRAEQAGFVNYVLDSAQLYDYFIAYKNDSHPNSNANFNVLSAQMYSALARHLKCSNRLGPEIDRWVNIPSTRKSRSSREHPLYGIASAAMDAHYPGSYVPVQSTGAEKSRHMTQRFKLTDQTTDLAGSHVLILDDLWVSGGSVDSLALALRQNGASYISALCLGRQVNERWEQGSHLVQMLKRPGATYHFEICPWNPDQPCHLPADIAETLHSPVQPSFRPRSTPS